MARTRNARGGRGRGCGGRGGGRGEPEVEAHNPLDLATIINQAVTALMPTLVAQVTVAMGGDNMNQNEALGAHGNQDGNGGNGGNVGPEGNEGNWEPNLRRANDGYRQGCTYKDFKNCGSLEFNGKGGAVGCIQWLEKIEDVISRSNCTYDQRNNYVTGVFTGNALSWWNTEVETRGRDATLDMSCTDFKNLMHVKYCPAHELQKLQLEFT